MAAEEMKVGDMVTEFNSIRNEYDKLKMQFRDLEKKYEDAIKVCESSHSSCESSQSSIDEEDLYNKNLRLKISQLFNNKLYSDVVILMSNKEKIYGHKLILSSRSNKWGDESLENMHFLDMSDRSYEVGYTILKWVYTGNVDIQKDETFITELLKASDYYFLTPLFKRCEEAILPYIKKANQKIYYELGKNLRSEAIKNACIDVACGGSRITVYPNKVATNMDNEEEGDEDDGDQKSETDDKNHGDVKLNLQCETCDKIFESLRLFQRHQKWHEKQKKKFPDTEQDPLKPLNSMQAKKGLTDFRCDICDKTFTTSFSLDRHKLIHSTDRDFACSECGKSYKTMDTLKHHLRYAHKPREKTFVCEQCGQAFYLRNELKKHRNTHSDIRPFECNICGKKFKEKGHLVRHKTLHTGVKAFVCDICGWAFSEKGNLDKHTNNKHKGIRNYECKECHKRFSTMNYLKKHNLIHSGEKPFQCKICNRSFAIKGNMMKHQMVHTGEKPYKCEICNKGFTERGHLRRHEKVHLKKGKNKDTLKSEPGEVVLLVVKEEGQIEQQVGSLDEHGNFVNSDGQVMVTNHSKEVIQAFNEGQGEVIIAQGQSIVDGQGQVILNVDEHGNFISTEGHVIQGQAQLIDTSCNFNQGEFIDSKEGLLTIESMSVN